jgi:hypothetical protein
VGVGDRGGQHLLPHVIARAVGSLATLAELASHARTAGSTLERIFLDVTGNGGTA